MKNRYGNLTMQAAYENAYDCLYFGYGRDSWNNCGISDIEADEVWRTAYKDITSCF